MVGLVEHLEFSYALYLELPWSQLVRMPSGCESAGLAELCLRNIESLEWVDSGRERGNLSRQLTKCIGIINRSPILITFQSESCKY